ncbi:MAG: hypothetical protein JNK72_13660 [Myxococcales bacterium]|nr:hypothetical protein [Myxococcales bacterium]
MSVAVACDEGELIFQRWATTWMVDHIASVSASNDEDPEGDDGDEGDPHDEGGARELGSTSVSLDEVEHLSELERRRYFQRQLRKLGVKPQSLAARVLWRLVRDPRGFVPGLAG